MDASCCAKPVADWTVTIEGDHFREVIKCASCGALHQDEVLPAPVRWPRDGECCNCGGAIGMDARCEGCQLTEQECEDMHHRLATAENGQPGLLVAAVRALDAGKPVMAIKLATGAAKSGEDVSFARFVRLQALASGGLVDLALDEAWQWIEEGEDELPEELFTWLTAMEAESGNMPGIRRALEVALQVMPENYGIWTDYGELMLALEEPKKALKAAAYALHDHNLEIKGRNLDVILEIAEDLYRRELYAEALAAVGVAGDAAETSVGLAWLRARIAALKNDVETSRQWLQLVLSLAPDHAEALAAWDKIKPEKRKGWFSRS